MKTSCCSAIRCHACNCGHSHIRALFCFPTACTLCICLLLQQLSTVRAIHIDVLTTRQDWKPLLRQWNPSSPSSPSSRSSSSPTSDLRKAYSYPEVDLLTAPVAATFRFLRHQERNNHSMALPLQTAQAGDIHLKCLPGAIALIRQLLCLPLIPRPPPPTTATPQLLSTAPANNGVANEQPAPTLVGQNFALSDDVNPRDNGEEQWRWCNCSSTNCRRTVSMVLLMTFAALNLYQYLCVPSSHLKALHFCLSVGVVVVYVSCLVVWERFQHGWKKIEFAGNRLVLCRV